MLMNKFPFFVSFLFQVSFLSAFFCIAEAQDVSLVTPSAIDSTSCGTHNGHEWIDLGLSVKWATCNVGAASPQDFGNYYAWGETNSPVDYSMADYRFRISGDCWENFRFSKYTTPLALRLSKLLSVDNRGIVDNKTVLELSDDAANANWGGSWRMPTVEEWQELELYCTWIWTVQGKTKGYKVVSEINGNSIFLPATGFPRHTDSRLRYLNVGGYYWSSSLYKIDSADAYSIIFTETGVNIHSCSRMNWRSIRPVL